MASDGLTLRNLTIGYSLKGHREKILAAGITAKAAPGELVCLTGRNGTGKSTLLRTIAGFQPPLGGDITIGGRSLPKMSLAEKARTIGLVLTDRPQTGYMTVGELVALGRTPYTGFWGKLGKADKKAVREALEMTGMESFANRRADELSDGERQRVMTAKALAQQTPLILLDEPTAFLDYPGKKTMAALLRRIAHEGAKTIIVASHDLDIMLEAADTAWVIDGGRLVAGPADNPAMAAAIRKYKEETAR